jgi:dTDP-4-amino-4,6-dideoxygalactose transaminase
VYTRIPSIGTPIDTASILRGIRGGAFEEQFSRMLCEMTGRKYCTLTGSGTTALYLILMSLRRLSPDGRSEVLMPAYTAPSLILAMREADTTPSLSEVSTVTFNQDLHKMAVLLDDKTLAVMPVHMYGLVEDLSDLEEQAHQQGVFLMEDAASAMGSRVCGRPAGSMGDVSFFSFNRGKNLSTVTGGAVLTDNRDISEAVEDEENRLRSPDGVMKLHTLLKAVGLSLIWRPAFYSLLWPVARGYRYQGLHEQVDLLNYTPFQASLGCSLMERKEAVFARRHENGMFLHDSLKGCEYLKIPDIAAGSYTVFNQFPVIVPGASREEILRELRSIGFDATTLYPLPVHKVYDLGYVTQPDPFPIASTLAGRIILLPVHPGVGLRDLSKAVRILTDKKWRRRNSADTS